MVVDTQGNRAEATGSIKVTIQAIDEIDGVANLPTLRGTLKSKFVDGVATLENICLTEGVYLRPKQFFNLIFNFIGRKNGSL